MAEQTTRRESLGKIVGKTLLEPGLNLAREKVRGFNVNAKGKEVLEQFKDKPFLIVANHVRPTSSAAEQSQLSPDGFVIEREVFEITGKKLKMVAKADDGWIASNPARRKLQKWSHPFMKGVVKGAGEIPVYKNPGSLNRQLMSDVNQAIQAGYPILVFPQGVWLDDFDPNLKFHSGAARIALDNNLPIIPTYIEGCDTWSKGTKVDLVFGEPIYPDGQSIAGISEAMRQGIIQAQQSAKTLSISVA